jgi:hypothetical protein
MFSHLRVERVDVHRLGGPVLTATRLLLPHGMLLEEIRWIRRMTAATLAVVTFEFPPGDAAVADDWPSNAELETPI